jgi:ATP-dependent Clp protease ATP-binding subunit ClpA
MFERFTDHARQVVVLAQEEARTLRHNHIGTEHILLGLLREEAGVAGAVLESLDITLERARAEVVRIIGPANGASAGQIPFTPRAKKVLELALREALALGDQHIGSEHILLGLVRESDGGAMRILLDQNVDADTVRDGVMRARRTTEPSLTRVVPENRVESVSVSRDDPGAMLTMIERQIRALLHREPDNGDLLVILATLPEGLVGRTLKELGVDDGALDAALARARAAGPDEIEDQLERARVSKDVAIDAGDFQEAARLRAEERRLERERDTDLIGRVRVRLGLAPSAPGAAE